MWSAPLLETTQLQLCLFNESVWKESPSLPPNREKEHVRQYLDLYIMWAKKLNPGFCLGFTLSQSEQYSDLVKEWLIIWQHQEIRRKKTFIPNCFETHSWLKLQLWLSNRQAFHLCLWHSCDKFCWKHGLVCTIPPPSFIAFSKFCQQLSAFPLTVGTGTPPVDSLTAR